MNRFSAFSLLTVTALNVSAFAQDPVAFDTGRPRPALAGMPVLGSGLAMSGGSFQGVPAGERPEWTVSMWFQARSLEAGTLFRSSEDGGLEIASAQGKLILRKDPDNRKKQLEIILAEMDTDVWHHVVVACRHGVGISAYLDGKECADRSEGRLGHATPFDEYAFGSGKRKDGSFTEAFDGLIDDFELHDRRLTADEVQRLFQGESFNDSLIAFNDFEDVSHRDLAVFGESDRDEAYLDEGRKLYELNCIACHSKDGISPPLNPLSRHFSKHPMENGGDPLSMFRTVTFGFRNMMPAVQLSPLQRYQVIHYIRERLIKKHAPELYVETPDGYTDAMPLNAESSGKEAAKVESLAKVGYLRDYGKALCTTVENANNGENSSRNALVIDLGNETTLGYDLGTMSSIGAWTGGFLDISFTLHHKLRANGKPKARFDDLPGTDDWRWAWDGRVENPVPDLSPRTVWPEDQLRYNGHYPHGDEIVLSYSVQGREVLESPLAQSAGGHTILNRRLTVQPGTNVIEAVVLGAKGSPPKISGTDVVIKKDGRRFLAWLNGTVESVQWRASEEGDLVLRIPASEEVVSINVAVASAKAGATVAFERVNHAIDLTKRTQGGPTRWSQTHTMKGKLETAAFQGYALDSLPVPLNNAYNSWMRTASLAFFPDGRLAVGTLAGDVWIVSGVDEGLREVTWKRFAAGLYEPLGMKVIDGVLTAITRGRVVKLHDLNADGEADFYEAFYNEDEPDNGWHAYNFDLEVGDDGSLYYARVGGFSDWSVPGGITRVAKGGEYAEVIGAGMRVPNGLGLLPDGRITFGDNQGTYVPASKIAITYPGAFHGAGKWDQREGDFDPKKIVPPVVYMPQELDSSSGSQLWVDQDDRFGPLSGQLFHTSYGRARTMTVMMDEFDDVTQGAVFSLPLQMESGTMRVAKSPIDGQLYYSGLTGWQSGGTREGSIQRLRYTGENGLYLLDTKARKGRLELTFNQPLDEDGIDLEEWLAEAWNYRWGKQYGSPHFRVTKPDEEGTDEFEIEGFELKDGGRRLILEVPDLEPCHSLRLDFEVSSKDETLHLEGPVYWTIHALPN